MLNKRELYSQMALQEMNFTDLCKKSGISYATLHRKVSKGTGFYDYEIEAVSKALDLTKKARDNIFFS